MPTSLFGGTDWIALAWATGLAALTGWSNMRIRQRENKDPACPPPTLADVLADTAIGTTAGVALALIVPEWVPRLSSLGGITALACIGGVGGRRVYDLGLSLMEYVARLRLGLQPPAPAPPAAASPPPVPKEEVNDHVR